MKTHNNHPQWSNEPIRLNEAQMKNPALIFDEFFQNYRLNEVRETMWQCLVAVVSCDDSVSNDHHERGNHLHFYGQIEMLVEGVWVMYKGKDKLPATNNPRYSKPARLIDRVEEQPEEVIKEVFSELTLDDLYEYLLPTWLRVAIINNDSPYSDGDSREILNEFYDQLLEFIEALYIIYEAPADHKAYCLNAEQLADPRQVEVDFFQQFSIEYIRRELHDFLEAGIGYAGVYPDGFTPWQAWMVYGHVVGLAEGAYCIYGGQ